jgi:alkanesulfonate monooxygenase SsuD/methylene tetrahydromethanopterin reductase-like flavin-dependent oxidoreductase (luciferase family)
MRLGTFMMPYHDPKRDLQQVLIEDVDTVVHADAVGFDEAWIGEHYFAPSEPITSPFVFLANLIARTRRIKLCTGVINTPQQHPALIAGHAALLDHLSGGRMMLGVGPGGLPSDIEAFKTTDPVARSAMLAESIDMILKLWGQDAPYELKGKHWDITLTNFLIPERGVGNMIRPLQRPHPPLATTAVSPFSGTAKLAGARGMHLISGHFCPVDTIRSHWQAYSEAAEKANKKPDARKWAIARPIFVAPDDASARAFFYDPKGPFFELYDYLLSLVRRANMVQIWKSRPEMDDELVTTEYALREFGICGGPQSVADQILALREKTGPFGGIIAMAIELKDRARIFESMRLLGEDVLPRIKRTIGAAN